VNHIMTNNPNGFQKTRNHSRSTPCKYILLFAILMILGFGSICYSMDVTLGWDPNSEFTLAGYKIYYKVDFSGGPYDGVGADQGPSPITVPVIELGHPSYPEFNLTGLDDAKTYYIVITAYNTDGLESGFSNEVSAKKADSEPEPDPPEESPGPELPEPDPPENLPDAVPDGHENNASGLAGGGCFLMSGINR
jgi:hypothetical protein